MHKKPSTILFTIPNFITAGSGNVVYDIVRFLPKELFTPIVCVTRRGGRFYDLLQAMDVPIIEANFTVPARPYYQLPHKIIGAALRFGRLEIDIWHSFHYLDDYTEPLIARAAGTKAWIYSKKNMSWGSRGWKLRTFLATGIVALNTRMLTEFFASPRDRAKVKIIPPGVDPTVYSTEISPQLGLRNKLQIGDNYLIGCVANLIPVKGQDTLIRALEEVPNAHLVLAGKPLDAKYITGLKELCTGLGLTHRVHFLGQIENIPALLRELDLFVLSSKKDMEGCPVALLEAMSSAVPCVAPIIPGVEDVIVHEDTGILVPPDDPMALASAIGSALASETRKLMGARARDRILELYTAERSAKEHQEYYQALLGRGFRETCG